MYGYSCTSGLCAGAVVDSNKPASDAAAAATSNASSTPSSSSWGCDLCGKEVAVEAVEKINTVIREMKSEVDSGIGELSELIPLYEYHKVSLVSYTTVIYICL